MKKCIAFAAALLILIMCGCTSQEAQTQTTEPAQSGQQASGKQTDEDIVDVLGNLLYKASLVDELFTKGLETETKKEKAEGDYRSCCVYLKVAKDSKFKSVDDIKKAVYEVYTADAAADLYINYYFDSGYPLYKDYNGSLYYNVKYEAEPKMMAYMLSKAEIVEKSDKYVRLTVPTTDCYDTESDSNMLLDSCMVLENESGTWKLARSGVKVNASFLLEYDMIEKKYAYSGDFCSLAPRSKYEDGNRAYVLSWGSVSKYGGRDKTQAAVAKFDEKCLTGKAGFISDSGGSNIILIVPKYTNSTVNIFEVSGGKRGKLALTTSGSVFLTVGRGKDSIKYEVEIITPDSDEVISFKPYLSGLLDWLELPDGVGELYGYYD